MKCRHCNTELEFVFCNLGNSPVSNDLLTKDQLNQPEVFYPLKVYVCHNCFLVQIDEFKKHESIFNEEYVYFSSCSSSWLEHVKNYTNQMIDRFGFSQNNLIVEIASNDGYLLQYFHEKGISVLGIEPTRNTAEVAIKKGIHTVVDFFSADFALNNFKEKKADLIIGNNVLAHVPNINDFVKGMKYSLAPTGIITMEFPHLLNLISEKQFDTIYHEHFSYLSFYSVKRIFESFELQLFDVEEIPTHGGSLRIYAKHHSDNTKSITKSVDELRIKENKFCINNIETYFNFSEKIKKVKFDFLNFLITQKKKNKKIVAYGAAAKGNTLLNYCGIKEDIIEYVVDISKTKQGKYLPGSHISIVSEDKIRQDKPDFIVIFPWNIKEEIINQLIYVREWNCQFVIAIPELKIL